MRWWISFCWFAVLASSGWNARITKRALFTKGLITNVLTNRTAELAKTFGHVNGKVGQKIGKEGATLVNPFSSHTGSALETLGNKSLIISESVGNTTADIIAKVFKDEDIIALQDGLAKALHIHNPKYMDADEFRRLLGTFSFINVKTRLLSLDATFCGICQLFINGIQLDAHIITKVAEFVCKVVITLMTLTPSTFCQDIIQLNLPVLQYIVDNSEILDPELACTILLQSKACHFEKPALSWTTALPVTKPIYPEVPSNSKGKKTLKILHLTDPHISSDYENGAVANCGYPICCKKGLGNQFNGDTAGYWGHYDCDIPPWLFSSTLNHINHTHKDIDFIYFTGDIIDHTVWASSVKENSELINYTFTTLEQTFPNKSVYPVIGNHESTPLNIYAPAKQDIETKGLSTSWLYTLMAKLWKPWLSKESLDTVTQQGYYAYSVNKKLKVIGLNNNVCYKFNWWLLYDTQYINEQLQFLANELVESENNGQYVHILAHVSVGNKECIEPWEASYNALVKRFSHIIKGQFVGHTHTDELKIFYDDNGKPINMAYNGASLTPFEKYNPNYKILEVDPDTMDIIDIHTYIFNLTEANLHEDRSPAWYKLYSMKEAYGMADLSPESFDNLAERMNNNATLLHEYWRYYVRDGDASLKMGCDEKCKREIFCQVITTYSFHPSKSYCDDV